MILRSSLLSQSISLTPSHLISEICFETLLLLMKKTRAKKFKVRMFDHLQNLFWGVFVLGVSVGGLCPGFFCPVTITLRAGFIKFHQLFQRSLVMGRGHSASALYSVKLCVMINFSLCHNVLCFSFVVVLYSMYSLYAIKWLPLMKEIVLCNNNLRLKSPLTRSTDH